MKLQWTPMKFKNSLGNTLISYSNKLKNFFKWNNFYIHLAYKLKCHKQTDLQQATRLKQN